MKRRKRLLLILLLLLIAVLLIGLFWPRERLLLQKAMRVTDTRGWEVDRGPDACISYGWLSDQDVFFCRGGFLSESPLCKRNVRTGEQTSLTALSRHFHRTGGDPDGIEISPDGRWILWTGGQNATVCAALDGSSCRRFPCPAEGYSGYHWISGEAAQWIELKAKRADSQRWSEAALHRADASSPAQALSLPAPFSDPLLNGVAVETAEGLSLLTPSWRDKSDPGLPGGSGPEITRTSLGLRAQPMRRFSLPMPPHSSITAIVLSPDGKQAAWLLLSDAVNPLLALAHRLFPKISAPSQRRAELWVSRIDGSGVHEIGHLPVPVGEYPIDWLDGYTLHWLPGGDKLSFVYNEALYTVSVE